MVNYALISFLLRGKRRVKVLKTLNNDNPKIPKDIAEECRISISNVSNSLAELLDKGLIKCINPKDHFYRFYKITNNGKEVLKNLK
ncbi:winged helix-turn-helix transcriptional regulator [Candidatus Woesearchaeota archaeon]|nr:winged helix-turn-helix transcriptional regulator [Candidatus Woesearchaeota archaeon]